MVQPIRPHDASGIYRTQGASAGTPAEGATGRRRGSAAGGATGRTDSATFSARALELARAQEAAQRSPELRAGRIAQVRAQIADGTYRVDPLAVARALLESASGAPIGSPTADIPPADAASADRTGAP